MIGQSHSLALDPSLLIPLQSHYFRMETISVLLPTNDAGSARQKLPRLRRMRDFDFPILQDLETAANPDFIDDIVRELTEGE